MSFEAMRRATEQFEDAVSRLTMHYQSELAEAHREYQRALSAAMLGTSPPAAKPVTTPPNERK